MPAPDVCYVLDGAVELCEITADAHFFFMHLCPHVNTVVDRLEQHHPPIPSDTRTGSRFCNALMEFYAGWWRQAPKIDRDACSIAGLWSAKYQLKEIAGSIRIGAVRHVTDRGHTGRRGLRKAMSRRVMRHVMKTDPVCTEYLRLWREMLRRIRTVGPMDCRAACDRMNGLINQSNDLRSREIQMRRELIDKRNHRQRKHRRKVITKSYNLLRSVTGEETARAFIAGDGITIEGKDFDFIARRGGSLSETGHGAMRIEVADKSGVVLTDLCIYFDDIPAMDQVAALALHVMVGEEREILETGNYFSVREEGFASPLLDAKPHEAPVQLEDLDRLFLTDAGRLADRWRPELMQATEKLIACDFGRMGRMAMETLPVHNPAG